MIEVMQGTMGSGKSAVAVARAIMHLKKGGVVAANFSLVDGWSDSVASRSILNKFKPERKYEKSKSLYNRFFNVKSVEAIRKINPRELGVDLHKDKGGYSEGAGLLILDECQLVFNTRKSMSGDKNLEWIEFFTQSRKLGWNVILIAHTIDMIDSQIRPLAEYESRFRNLQKLKIPIIGLPYSPFPLFLVITRYAGLGAGASVVADRDLFPLPLWAAKLYDSLEIFSQSSWGTNSEPTLCGKPPKPPHLDNHPYGADVIRTSTLSDSCLWSKQYVLDGFNA
jgi:hypothetical protein